MYTSVMKILDEADIPYQVLPHSRSVFTVEEAARERGVRPAQIVKVMIVKTSGGSLAAILLPGNKRLDLRRARCELKDKKLRLAPPAEIERETGFPVGAISPVGIHSQMPLYVDRGLLNEEWVAMSSGSPDAGVVLESERLVELIGGRLGDFTSPAK